MFDKYKYSLDKIKEVKLWWDFEYVIFPKEVIKRLEYEINEENSMSYRCLVSSFRIEVDLDYVNSGYVGSDEEKREDRKIIDLLKGNNIWNISIVNEEDCEYEFDVPSYEKDFLLNQDGVNEWNAINRLEHHEIVGDTYIIDFKIDDKDIFLTFLEMMKAFKSSKIASYHTGKDLKLEVLFRCFADIYYDKNMVKQKEVLFKLLTRFMRFVVRKPYSFFCDYSKGYKFEVIDEGKLVKYFGKNHSYKTLINYVFISDMEDTSLVNDLLPIENSKHNASFIVVIYDNNIDEVKLKEKLGDEVIYLSKSKLDEYWLSIIKIWYLGIGGEELWRFK